jgi:hypothetical protein
MAISQYDSRYARRHGWAKKRKKVDRRERLCRKKRIAFDNKDVVADFEVSIVDEWCEKELNGAFFWYRSMSWDWDCGEERSYDIGFQDETDMLAFTLRWLGK